MSTVIKNTRRIFTGGDTALQGRIDVLENNKLKITYFEEINTTSGTITIPTGATILLDQFQSGADAYVSTIQNSQPTGIFPKTSLGVTVDVASFDALGNFVLSGTPSAYPVALIYILKINAKDYYNLNIDHILDEDEVSNIGATQIPYGDSNGRMVGDSSLTYNSGNFQIGNGIPLIRTILSIIGTTGPLGEVSQSVTNTTNNGYSRYIIGQNVSNWAQLATLGSAFVGTYSGTSISLANTSYLAASSDVDGNYSVRSLLFMAASFINLSGQNATNFGTRLDSVGYRIGQLSTLHLGNNYPFQVDGTPGNYFAWTGLNIESNNFHIGHSGGNYMMWLKQPTGIFSAGTSGPYNDYLAVALNQVYLVVGGNNKLSLTTSLVNVLTNFRVGGAGQDGPGNLEYAPGELKVHMVSNAESVASIFRLSSVNNTRGNLYLAKYSDGYSGNYSGTSIVKYWTSHISDFGTSDASDAVFGSGLALGGKVIYNLVGSVATNYGTRLDATGFRIGLLNTLHSANTVAFQADFIQINGSGIINTASNMGIYSTGAIFIGQTNATKVRIGDNGALPTYNLEVAGNSYFEAEVKINSSTTSRPHINLVAGVAPTSPTNGDIWFDGTHFYGRVGGVTKQLDN